MTFHLRCVLRGIALVLAAAVCLGQNCVPGEPGRVVSTNPIDGATGVATNATIDITFDKAVDINSLDGGISPDVPFGLNPGVDGNTVSVVPQQALSANTPYTVTITAATFTDGAGLAGPHTFSFTTGSGTDTPPPPPTSGFSIVSITPADQSTNVSLTPTVQVTFSEAADPPTLQGDFQPSTTDFSQEWNATNTVLTVALVGPLAADTTYSLAIVSILTPGGVGLSNPQSSCFSTGATLNCPTFECLSFDATDANVPAVSGYTYVRPFAASSVWNTSIGANPTVDPNSNTMIARFAQSHQQFGGLWVGVMRDVIPVYLADASTPRYDVPLSAPNTGVAAVMSQVPIPDHALADCGFDRFLMTLDTTTNTYYEMHRAEKTDTGWQAATGNSIDGASGSGIHPGDGDRSAQGVRASGSSMAAGLIWPQELAAGQIDHALAFGYEFIRTGGPVSPFTASDGQHDDLAALPMGSHLQLDPALDLNSLGLDPWERTIAVALQTYGMYLVDSAGGIPLAAVHVHSFQGNPYQGLLPDTAIQEGGTLLSKLPPDRFRVLSP